MGKANLPPGLLCNSVSLAGKGFKGLTTYFFGNSNMMMPFRSMFTLWLKMATEWSV